MKWLDNCLFRLRQSGLYRTLQSDQGMGVVEVILIIVVLISLVILFQKNINGVVASIFETIQNNAAVVQ